MANIKSYLFHPSLDSNLWKIYAFTFFTRFNLFISIIVPYLSSISLSMTDIAIIQASLSISMTLFEMPAGYISDIYGKKFTLILSAVFYLLGYSILLWANTLLHFILFEVCIGMAASLESGTDVSFLYDSIKASKKQHSYEEALSHKNIAKHAGFMLGSLLSSLLMIWGYRSVIWMQLIKSIFPIFLALSLVSTPGVKIKAQHLYRNILLIVRSVVHKKYDTFWIMLFLVLWSALLSMMIWIFQKKWMSVGISTNYFGILMALYAGSCIISSKLILHLVKKFRTDHILLCFGILAPLLLVGLGLTKKSWSSILLIYAIGLLSSVSSVTLLHQFNAKIPSRIRSSSNSAVSLLSSLAFFSMAPIVGYSMDHFSLNLTLCCGGFVILGLSLFFTHKMWKSIRY